MFTPFCFYDILICRWKQQPLFHLFLPEMLFFTFYSSMQHLNHKSARGVKLSEEMFSLTVNAPNVFSDCFVHLSLINLQKAEGRCISAASQLSRQSNCLKA